MTIEKVSYHTFGGGGSNTSIFQIPHQIYYTTCLQGCFLRNRDYYWVISRDYLCFKPSIRWWKVEYFSKGRLLLNLLHETAVTNAFEKERWKLRKYVTWSIKGEKWRKATQFSKGRLHSNLLHELAIEMIVGNYRWNLRQCVMRLIKAKKRILKRSSL